MNKTKKAVVMETLNLITATLIIVFLLIILFIIVLVAIEQKKEQEIKDIMELTESIKRVNLISFLNFKPKSGLIITSKEIVDISHKSSLDLFLLDLNIKEERFDLFFLQYPIETYVSGDYSFKYGIKGDKPLISYNYKIPDYYYNIIFQTIPEK